MTGLLVSVRSAEESAAALRGGADLIDIKEPLFGALGAADPQTWSSVAAIVGCRVPLSVALGELSSEHALARLDLRQLGESFRFVKVGLAGCRSNPRWREELANVWRRLPAKVTPVGVAYADSHRAAAPSPHRVLDFALQAGCGAFLLDTYDKSAGSLLAHLPLAAVADLVERARRHGLIAVLAGCLSLDTLGRVIPLKPDFVAVRGAVCRGARTGPIDEVLVRQLREVVYSQGMNV